MKVAVLSFAHERAATYVRLLRDRPDVELVTADPDAPPGDQSRGPALAERLGVGYAGSWDEVFAAGLDAAVVVNEPGGRRELVERAAQAGAHVLCEPPVAPSEDDAQAMIDACRGSGVGLTIAAPLRHSPAYAAVRGGITGGELGTLLTVHGVHNTVHPAPGRARTGEPTPPEGGAAVIADAACLLDLVDGLLDGESAEQVYAQANTLLDSASDVESAALVTVRYPNGLVVAVDCSRSRPAAQAEQEGPTMTFVGDRAIVDFHAFPRMLGGFDSVRSRTRWETGTADLNAAMLGDFLTGVDGGRPSAPDGESGLRTLRTLLAASRSVRTGQPVGVALPS